MRVGVVCVRLVDFKRVTVLDRACAKEKYKNRFLYHPARRCDISISRFDPMQVNGCECGVGRESFIAPELKFGFRLQILCIYDEL